MHFHFPEGFQQNRDYALQGESASISLRVLQKSFSNREAYLSPAYFLFFVLKGQKVFYEAEGQVSVEPGQFLLIRKNACLTCDVTRLDDGVFEAVMFLMEPQFIAEALKKYPLSQPATAPQERNLCCLEITPALKGAVESLLPLFMSAQNPQRDAAWQQQNQLLVRLKMEELLLHLLTYPDYLEPMLAVLGDASLPQRQLYLDLVQHCLAELLTVEAMAKQVGQSPTAFKQGFKDAFGKPPAQYLQEKRLEWAQQMLLMSEKNMTEIAMDTGFSSSSHFAQAFRKYYGQTPKAMRQTRQVLLA